MNLKNKLNLLTKLSEEKRSKAIKWVAKQNEEFIHLLFEKQKDHYFNISNAKDEKTVLYQSAIYLAANELYDAHRTLNTKNRKSNVNDISDTTKAQARQFNKYTRATPKTDKLLNLKGKILTLKDGEDYSFEKISAFLKRYHEIDVSHTWIRKVYNDIKDEK